ncbi:adhesin, partial [Corynebacterium sp. c8Ua_181]|nr:adhesin [Corynebacterium curieae]
MSILRKLSREGWMVFTAVLTAVAVVAAMFTVPGETAGAQEGKPSDFEPNLTLGDSAKKKELHGSDTSWGMLVWAGEPVTPNPGVTRKGPNPKNNVGWAWCLEPVESYTPHETMQLYDRAKAEKLKVPPEYHDAVINLGREMKSAAARGDKKAAANYYVYLTMFVAHHPESKAALAGTITGENPYYRQKEGHKNFPGYSGSHEEFTKLTGYRVAGRIDSPTLEKVPSVEIPKQPEDAYITVVWPSGARNGHAQTVMPVDQPGLPEKEETPTPEPPATDQPTEDTETTESEEPTEDTET